MRISIISGGAIGSALGALLAQAGHVIALIGASHVDAIIRNGLCADGCRGEFAAHLEAAEKLDSRLDLALLTVRTEGV